MIDIQRSRRGRHEVQINIAPLIDMVFILLIFFIVTTSFVKQTGVEVKTPIAKTAEKIKKANILIAVTKTGSIHIENKQVDLYTLRSIVSRLLKEMPEASVIIIADEHSHTGLVVKVMDQCRLAGAENISIAARKEK